MQQAGADPPPAKSEGAGRHSINKFNLWKELLLELISEWSGIIHDSAAKQKIEEVKSHLDETWFAWAGPLEAGKGYFRVQGPTLIIEFAPQRLGGDVTMHLHSMFRDPTNDYGAKFIKK